MTKVNREQYEQMLTMALHFTSAKVKATHDTLRPDIEYIRLGNVKIAEIRHKGEANEQIFMMDLNK